MNIPKIRLSADDILAVCKEWQSDYIKKHGLLPAGKYITASALEEANNDDFGVEPYDMNDYLEDYFYDHCDIVTEGYDRDAIKDMYSKGELMGLLNAKEIDIYSYSILIRVEGDCLTPVPVFMGKDGSIHTVDDFLCMRYEEAEGKETTSVYWGGEYSLANEADIEFTVYAEVNADRAFISRLENEYVKGVKDNLGSLGFNVDKSHRHRSSEKSDRHIA